MSVALNKIIFNITQMFNRCLVHLYTLWNWLELNVIQGLQLWLLVTNNNDKNKTEQKKSTQKIMINQQPTFHQTEK